MSKPSSCPDPSQLKALLESRLPADRQEELTRHLDSCEECQNDLELLATGAGTLPKCLKHIDREQPVADSAYWPAVQTLESSQTLLLPSADTPPAAGGPAKLLHFLSPSENIGHLGRLGQFEVVREVGRGGMGVVLHGIDDCLQRDVAIKVLDPLLAHDEVARKRFCREARAAASVTHENVVAIHQVEEDEGSGLPYLVMQLVSGGSLEDRLVKEGALEPTEVVRIGLQIASGLAAAHEKGLIHRDVKPANVLLERATGKVKLTDFGLARSAEDVRLTATGTVAGTPLYMAPEQARGEPVDHRADLFSLGVVLYEAATGTAPFEGKTPLAVLKRVTEERHRPVTELNPTTPAWLADLIDRLLAKDPAARVQSAREVADLLEHHWAALRSSSGVTPTAPPPPRRGGPVMLGVAGLAVVMLLGALVYRLWFNPGSGPRSDDGPVASAFAVLPGNAGAVWSVAFSRDGKTLATGAEDGTVKLWDLAGQRVRATLPGHRGVVWVAAYSPDGAFLATAGDEGAIHVWDLATNRSVRTLTHPNAVRGLAYHPGGKRLAGGDRQGGVRVWDPDTGDRLAEARQNGAVYALAYSPDGGTIATTGSDRAVHLWDAEKLDERLTLTGHAGPVYGLAFAPDGSQVVSVGWDQKVRLWDAGSGQEVVPLTGHTQDVWAVAVSPDGAAVLSGGQDYTARLWDRRTGKLLAVLRGHTSTVHSVAISRDGGTAATGSRDGTVRLWDVKPYLPGGGPTP